MNDWKTQAKAAVAATAGNPATAPAPVTVTVTVEQLEAAARVFNARTDNFAVGKGMTCWDLAQRLRRYKSFSTQKQADFAAALVKWAQPKPAESTDWGRPVPRLFAVMQRHATLHVEPMKLARKNGESLVWIIYNDACVGKIEQGRATVWTRKAELAGTTSLAVLDLIAEFEADPLEAAKKYGRLSGRCCSCGRDLTDPVSIYAGIGPVCATRFGGF